MRHPLYKDFPMPARRPLQGHAGLWFQRLFNRFDDDKWTVGETAKRDWLRTLEGGCGDNKALERAARRMLALSRAQGGQSRAFALGWRFATGLGLEHPVENGFTWHPTLGVPYLCGAAVKGLVRAWVECWEETDDESRQARLKDWFGNTEAAGSLVFFDALPLGPPVLATDVMTPHMGKWYEQGGGIENPAREPQKVPADWHDPVPVPFLVVREATFVFSIAPRVPGHADRVEPAFAALADALAWLGAGAKTAAGYGVMRPAGDALKNIEQDLEERQAAQEREQAEAALSPLERAIREVLAARQDANEPDYTTLVRALEQGRWQGGERVEVARRVQEMMKQAKKWKEQSNKPDKDKDYKRTRKVMAWLEGRE
ncbi:MAG: type III-B CRISPR module RAMP protein Cmr6 [Pseudomonadota bacterium]|nr:type III-B CRISPR module RAMP protein Cmr6 [Pseudomonadota bacterium]